MGRGCRKKSIFFFCSWKTYPWWLHSVISLVAMRGHASPCPTKISNKALSHHNWVLCTLYHTRYLKVCFMLCTFYHTQHHNWVSPYLLLHTVHCLAMYLVHCTYHTLEPKASGSHCIQRDWEKDDTWVQGPNAIYPFFHCNMIISLLTLCW